nr:hypothetical protein [Tanacetum cinerariifolium]GFA22203.1 hypothetical protein [Tanacetum cinerariifolium]
MMSTLVFVDPESSTQADRTQSSRVPIPLPEDPYEAIRQAYLVRTDTESEPFEDHPLTHTTPDLVPILRRTARMAVRVLPVMSPGLSGGMAKVAAMSDSAFCKRFRSSYDSSSSPTLPVRKRYRGTSELILGTDSEEDEEVEESLDSDSESKDVEDEGRTAEDDDPATKDKGLAAGVEGHSVDESYGLDGESHGVDDESHVKVQQKVMVKWEVNQTSTRVKVMSKRVVLVVGKQEHQYKPYRPLGLSMWPVLALEAWTGRVDTRMTDMSWARYDDHRLVHDMLLADRFTTRAAGDEGSCGCVGVGE